MRLIELSAPIFAVPYQLFDENHFRLSGSDRVAGEHEASQSGVGGEGADVANPREGWPRGLGEHTGGVHRKTHMGIRLNQIVCQIKIH